MSFLDDDYVIVNVKMVHIIVLSWLLLLSAASNLFFGAFSWVQRGAAD